MARLRSHKIALQSLLPLTTSDQAREAVTHVTTLECPLIKWVAFILVPPDEARTIFQRSTTLSEPPVTNVNASLQAAQVMLTASVIWASCLHYLITPSFTVPSLKLTYFPINKKTDALILEAPLDPFVRMSWHNEGLWAIRGNPLVNRVHKNLPNRRGGQR